jgi:carboxymethylenebutenolidase
MDKPLIELSEKFRKGLLSRRDFVQRVLLLTGSAAAASHALSTMGFDAGLIRETQAGEPPVETTGRYPSGDRMIDYFMVKPREGGPFPTMIVIHEIFGLSDFIKNVARLFANAGYLAMAPTLLPRPEDLPDGKHAQWMLDTMETGIAVVPKNEIDELNSGFDWLAKREDVDPEHIACVGFCWGGARAFTMATTNTKLWAAIPFYGSQPPADALANITAPVLALYGALDNASATSITGRAAETARQMRTLGKVFEWEVYNLAPHGFFRAADQSVSQERPALLAKDLMFDFLDRYYERG